MAGMTTSVGDAYSATLSGFSLVDKAKVIVRFDHDQTTDHGTLNVNGTGAKALADPNGYVRTSTVSGYVWGQNSARAAAGPGADASYSCCTYDQSLDVWIVNNDQYGYHGIDAGVPPEVCLQLCAEIGAHPWFCAPYLACDCGTGQLPSLSDYMTELAKYCRENAPSWMIPGLKLPMRPGMPGRVFMQRDMHSLSRLSATARATNTMRGTGSEQSAR